MSDRTSHESEASSIRIPMRLQRRGGRKRTVAPDGSELASASKAEPRGPELPHGGAIAARTPLGRDCAISATA
jgi:hypothetical protein